MSAVDSILGQAEAQAAQSKTSKTAQDKDMFLQLLVTQLTYQDPLNPAEDKEFIAQLAQFTQLEELQNVNGQLESMMEIADRGQFTSAVNLMGTRVVAKGDSLLKSQIEVYSLDDDGKKIEDPENETGFKTEIVSDTSPFYYSTEYDIITCDLTILDANTNAVVYSEALGPKKAGEQYNYTWGGTNSYGHEVPNGRYIIAITGKDANGQSQLIDTEIFGDVYSVENIGGEYFLHLTDGRQVKYTEVGMVGIPPTNNAANSGGGNGGSTGGADNGGSDAGEDAGGEEPPAE